MLSVLIYTNRFILLDIRNEIIAEVIAEKPFSNKRIIIADLNNAVINLKKLLNHPKVKRNFLGLIQEVTFIVMEKNEGGLCDIEKRAIIDVAQVCKVRKVHLKE